MTREKGLLISVGGDEQAELIESAIQDTGRFTTAVSTRLSPKKAELCLVSFTGSEIDYLGLSQGGRRVATGQKLITVSRLVPLNGISVDRLKSSMGARFASKLPEAFPESTRISPRLWEDLLTAITANAPRARDQLPRLHSLIAEYNSVGGHKEGGVEVLERDAVATALQVWGDTKFRKRVLRSVSPAADTETAPFLTRLSDVSIREDLQIVNDAATFPGMEVAQKYQIGAVLFENDAGERLTIMNCNRQPLEKTLGVDLIYYNHRFDSFVFVQYKRLIRPNGGTGKAVYRPDADKNYAAEIERMKAVEDLVRQNASPPASTVNSYRLSSHPFYFKLCEARIKSALDEGMVSGMYLPIELWDRFIGSSEAKGKHGGRVIGWDNCPRHFCNTEFTSLLRAGWIGSAAGESRVLEELIRSVIEGDHLLIIAATSSSLDRTDYLRDQFGRFASEDDPDASR